MARHAGSMHVCTPTPTPRDVSSSGDAHTATHTHTHTLRHVALPARFSYLVHMPISQVCNQVDVVAAVGPADVGTPPVPPDGEGDGRDRGGPMLWCTLTLTFITTARR